MSDPIAILGAGDVGGALGLRLAAAGRRVIFASRDPSAEGVQARVEAAGPLASAATAEQAVGAGGPVILALPWTAVEQALPPLAPALSGRVVIDATNPLAYDAGGLRLALGFDRSGGERVAELLPGARVVKAFNTTGWANMVEPVVEGRRSVMFLCGDDETACDTARALIEAVGFEPVHAGPLCNARLTEAHAMLWIDLAMQRGLGRDFAFGLLRRSEPTDTP